MGHVRPRLLASQTKLTPCPWILRVYTEEGCPHNFIPERPVLQLRVSGQSDDVRRFLRGIEALLSKSSRVIGYISLHIGSLRYGLKSATDSVRQFLRLRMNGGGRSHAKS